LLASEGAALDMGVTVVPPVTVSGLTCSSTKVREFALEGRVEGAAMLLGRPLEVTGAVIHGAGRGRGLGIPTANLRPEAELLPRPGIYAGRALSLDGSGAGGAPAVAHLCALSIGTNPTFSSSDGGGGLSIEAHLLDFDGDLYGRRLRLEIVHRLRDEQRFESIAALVARIQEDLRETRKVMGR
jgi:riboflavin kinase/FMN adenylyltransferase